MKNLKPAITTATLVLLLACSGCGSDSKEARAPEEFHGPQSADQLQMASGDEGPPTGAAARSAEGGD